MNHLSEHGVTAMFSHEDKSGSGRKKSFKKYNNISGLW